MKLVLEYTYETGRVCPQDADEEKLKELADNQKWATCPNSRT